MHHPDLSYVILLLDIFVSKRRRNSKQFPTSIKHVYPSLYTRRRALGTRSKEVRYPTGGCVVVTEARHPAPSAVGALDPAFRATSSTYLTRAPHLACRKTKKIRRRS